MLEIIKELSKLRFQVVIFIGGLLLLSLSSLSRLPTPVNGWVFELRTNPSVFLLASGLLLITASVITHLYAPESEDRPRILLAINIKRSYERSSDTQKTILRTLHESHKREVTLEEFYLFLQKKHGADLVKSEDELYFRLKDLASKRLLYLKSVGKNSSSLQPLEKVGKVLNFPSG